MIYEVVDAIAARLAKNYDYDVHINKLPQDFEEPCFFIKLISNDENQLVDNRYYRKNTFDIAFFHENNNVDLYKKTDELTDILEYVRTENGDLLRGINRKSEIADGVLHFITSYDYTVVKPKETQPLMEELKIKGGINNGRKKS